MGSRQGSQSLLPWTVRFSGHVSQGHLLSTPSSGGRGTGTGEGLSQACGTQFGHKPLVLWPLIPAQPAQGSRPSASPRCWGTED